MAQPAPPGREDRPDGPQDRGWTRWLAAGTFVLGLVAGALLVGLLGQAPPVPRPAQEAASASTAGPTSTAGPGDRVGIEPACLRALNAAQDIAATADDLGAAAAALDAAQLDEVVRRLQPLQARLGESRAACEASGSLPTEGAEPTGRGEPTPPASPTG
ncbi:hypothetical protein [Geodermatophilus poikilotrophus]|uniref:Uncharacterized protein n=1 Tax=Geodermatophilus poikilotrophus TaxID=1333667 RepID=A0A1H9ZE67_9ACTN|nr:hypothetical protein [Geodermatophilus poikilotrophus]SES79873.1 hypothetical protein SAMN04488546_0546 [Geodermatophilus poikilotrophus]